MRRLIRGTVGARWWIPNDVWSQSILRFFHIRAEAKGLDLRLPATSCEMCFIKSKPRGMFTAARSALRRKPSLRLWPQVLAFCKAGVSFLEMFCQKVQRNVRGFK